MIYLASPYSDPNKTIEVARYDAVLRYFAHLCKRGHKVYCPIGACHEAARLHDMPTDAEWWEAMNTEFINNCDEIYVLTLTGWQKSRGVTQEINLAFELGKKVTLINSDYNIVGGLNENL